MSGQNQDFQQRWEFRRNDIDLDSSGDELSRPESSRAPKLKKDKQVCEALPKEKNQDGVRSSQPGPGTETQLCPEESNKEPNKPPKKRNLKGKGTSGVEKKVRSRAPKTTRSAPESDDEFVELRNFSKSLIEGLKVARVELIKWMSKELGTSIPTTVPVLSHLGTSIPDSMKSTESKGRGRGQSQNAKRTISQERKRKGKATEKNGGQSLDNISTPTNKEVVEPPKEMEKMPTSMTDTVALTEKQKGKRSKPAPKKQKMTVANQQSYDKPAVSAAPAPNYLTLPTVLPRPQNENNTNTWSPVGEQNENVMGERNPTMNPGVQLTGFPRTQQQRDVGERIVLNSQINQGAQLTGFPRTQQQRDVVFAQTGYEQNTVRTPGNFRGNVTGNESANANANANANASANANANSFSFSLPPQGINGGFANPSQYGLQFLSQQGNWMPGMRMNVGPTRLPDGNQSFMDSYAALNQQLRLRTQGGMAPPPYPDNMGPNFQPK